jgi:hypothetical protein
MTFLDEALDTQAFLVGRSTAKTAVGRRVAVLEAFHAKRLQESRPRAANPLKEGKNHPRNWFELLIRREANLVKYNAALGGTSALAVRERKRSCL